MGPFIYRTPRIIKVFSTVTSAQKGAFLNALWKEFWPENAIIFEESDYVEGHKKLHLLTNYLESNAEILNDI